MEHGVTRLLHSEFLTDAQAAHPCAHKDLLCMFLVKAYGVTSLFITLTKSPLASLTVISNLCQQHASPHEAVRQRRQW